MGRFVKGKSGNPNGRPRKRRPIVSAFDILFDKRLTVTQNGEERELTVDEALQLQTYQAALCGSRLAVRAVLKVIEKREQALRLLQPAIVPDRLKVKVTFDSDSADDAMLLLGIICRNPEQSGDRGPRTILVNTWAAQAAFSWPGRRKLDEPKDDNLCLFIKDFAKLRRSRGAER